MKNLRNELWRSAMLDEYHKLSGIFINDKKFELVCEIITMVIHLRIFYCLGSSQIDMRVGIIRDLLGKVVL